MVAPPVFGGAAAVVAPPPPPVAVPPPPPSPPGPCGKMECHEFVAVVAGFMFVFGFAIFIHQRHFARRERRVHDEIEAGLERAIEALPVAPASPERATASWPSAL